MIYNDNPILDDKTYNLIMSQYEKALPFDRKTCLSHLFISFNECLAVCYGLEDKMNKKIEEAIIYTENEIKKLIDNLDATSNFEHNQNQKNEIITFNVFNLLKKLIKIMKILQNWEENEQKEYYKKLSRSTQTCVLSIIEKIINSMEFSNIHFFKYM